jgi:hypothetical protein
MGQVFPAELWTSEPDAAGMPGELVRLAAARPTWRERLAGPFQAAETRLLRLLRAVRTGTSAEMDGRHQRADFYFDIACGELERLCRRRRACDALSAACGVPDIRAAITRELFLATHAGFIHGYLRMKGETSDARIQKHAAWADRAVRLAGLSAEETAAARAWLWNHVIVALQRTGARGEALEVFERALEPSSPGWFKDGYVRGLWEQTTNGLEEGEADGQHERNGVRIGEALTRFRRVFGNVSDRPLAWERLADLHRRQIAALPDTDMPGRRIAVLQRAVDADPFDLATHTLDVQARFALNDLQEQIARVEQEAAAQGKVLNDKGLALKAGAAGGFDEACTYLASAESSTIQQSARTAWAAQIWAGLGLPQEEGWQQQAIAVLDATGAALVRCELTAPAFAAALDAELDTRAGLRDRDAAALVQGLLSLQGAVPSPAPRADPADPASLESTAALPVAGDRGIPGSEDFRDWFFSPKGVATRVSLVAAAVLLITASALTTYGRYVEGQRLELFPLVLAAARENEHERVTELAARFLSKRPLNGRGQMDQAVEQAYAEALVGWFARSAGPPSPSLIRAARMYQQLVGDPMEERQ